MSDETAWDREGIGALMSRDLERTKGRIAARHGCTVHDKPTCVGMWLYFSRDGSPPCEVEVEAIDPHPNGQEGEFVFLVDGEWTECESEYGGLWGWQKGADDER